MNTGLYLKFCSRDETRIALTLPIDDGEWTYCSDGRVAIRVPKFEHEQNTHAGQPIASLIALFAYDNYVEYRPLPIEPPEKWGKVCDVCEGKGSTNRVQCDSCGECVTLRARIECPNCDGSGRNYFNVFVPFGNQLINPKYIRMISTLPNVVMANHPSDGPLSFKFDGGTGLLMPMRKP